LIKRAKELSKDIEFNKFLNEGDINGVTCLHIACLRGKVEIVNILISNGASCNATDMKKNNPCHYLLYYLSVLQSHLKSEKFKRGHSKKKFF
jgi:ankyrin repeat protein